MTESQRFDLHIVPAEIAAQVSYKMGLNISAAIEIAVNSMFGPIINDGAEIKKLLDFYEKDSMFHGDTVNRKYYFSLELLRLLSEIKMWRKIPRTRQ